MKFHFQRQIGKNYAAARASDSAPSICSGRKQQHRALWAEVAHLSLAGLAQRSRRRENK